MSDRRTVRARVIGVPAPGIAVWRVDDQPEVTGDLEPAPAGVAVDDVVVVDIARERFRWHVVGLVDFVPQRRVPPRSTRRRRPHAHPSRPPGTVVIAWLPFTSEGDDAPGKHRPCVVLHSVDPDVLRVRPLFDPRSAVARGGEATPIRSWRAAGLDKASVAGPATEVPLARVEQTIATLLPDDRAALGIGAR